MFAVFLEGYPYLKKNFRVLKFKINIFLKHAPI